jgi:hypothetical protein
MESLKPISVSASLAKYLLGYVIGNPQPADLGRPADVGKIPLQLLKGDQRLKSESEKLNFRAQGSLTFGIFLFIPVVRQERL